MVESIYLRENGGWTFFQGEAVPAALAKRGIVISPTAKVGIGAHMGSRACMGEVSYLDAGSYLGSRACMGEGAYAGAGSYLGEGSYLGTVSRIGAGSRMGAWASIGTGAYLGARAYLGEGAHAGDGAYMGDGARVRTTADCIVIGPLGSRNAMLTGYRGNDGSLRLATGCFLGTPEEFEAAVAKTHGDTEHGRRYRDALAYIRMAIPPFDAEQRERFDAWVASFEERETSATPEAQARHPRSAGRGGAAVSAGDTKSGTRPMGADE